MLDLLNPIQKIINLSFLTGLSIGGVLGFIIKKYSVSHIDFEFDKKKDSYEKTKKRYEKLYSPLKQKLLGITIDSTGGILSFKQKLPYIFKGIVKGNLSYSWDIIKLNNRATKKEYYFDGFVGFDFKGTILHIKKYHDLADVKLLVLLDRAIRAENEKEYHEGMERSLGNKNFHDDRITPEMYNLIDHIDKYSVFLNNKVN